MVFNLSSIDLEDLLPKIVSSAAQESSLKGPVLSFRFSSQDEITLRGLLSEAANNSPAGQRTEIHSTTQTAPTALLSSPAAHIVLHNLSRKLTTAFCRASDLRSYELHPFVDELQVVLKDGPQFSHLLASKCVAAPLHVDRGLFNIVVGTAEDLADLSIAGFADFKSAATLLPPEDLAGLYSVLLPGLTLQLINPSVFEAVYHKVARQSAHRADIPMATLS